MTSRIQKTVALAALLAPMHLFAQAQAPASVEASKSAPLQSILPNAYGKVDVRHYFHRKTLGADNKLTYDPMFQPRLVLGSKFFEGRLDSQVIFGAENKTGTAHNSATMGDKGTRIENEFTVYKNDYVSFIPLLYIQLPKSTDEVRKPTKAELGIDIPVQYPVHTSAGIFAFEGEFTGKTYFSSRPDAEDRVALRDSDDRVITKNNIDLEKGMSLTDAQKKSMNLSADDKGVYKVNPNGRTFNTYFAVGASYAPSFVTGLKTTVLSQYETTYVPVMEYDRNSKTISNRKSGTRNVYTAAFEPSYLWRVKYEINPTYSVTNEFTLMSRAENQRKYSNMVSVVAKLF